jgi:ribosomal protein S25
MENKALLNQSSHAEGAGMTTKEKYAILRKKRNEYIIFLYSDEQIKQLATDFANSPEVSKTEFANKYDISINVLDTLLKKSITENIIDDETFAKIEKRSMSKDSSMRTKEFFRLLHERRNMKETALH